MSWWVPGLIEERMAFPISAYCSPSQVHEHVRTNGDDSSSCIHMETAPRLDLKLAISALAMFR